MSPGYESAVLDEETGQQKFDRLYITSLEICNKLEVTRPAVHRAKARGLLPDPIQVGGHMDIWERAKIRPYLDAWKIALASRRGELA